MSGAATAAVIELAGPGQKARAGFAATAANMGGLGCGPLLSGLLAQYAPWPLMLPFWVHLGLVAVASGITWFLPETVAEPKRWPPLQPQGVRVPPEVKGVFAPAAVAAFAGFALLGLFTAVAPSFASQTLGVHNLAVTGAVVFSVFLASTVGQSLTQRIGARLALPVGCAILVVGLMLVASSLIAESLALLVLGALFGGAGQGLAFRAALTLISGAAPAQHRGGTISAFFVVAYAGISLPVVGVGAMATWLGLREAGLIFTGCVMLLAASAGTYAALRPPTGRSGPAPTGSRRRMLRSVRRLPCFGDGRVSQRCRGSTSRGSWPGRGGADGWWRSAGRTGRRRPGRDLRGVRFRSDHGEQVGRRPRGWHPRRGRTRPRSGIVASPTWQLRRPPVVRSYLTRA